MQRRYGPKDSMLDVGKSFLRLLSQNKLNNIALDSPGGIETVATRMQAKDQVRDVISDAQA